MSDRAYLHTEDPRSDSGHLNSTWEIAILIVFIILIVAILGTTLFQIRRKRQRRRDREAVEEAEMGTSRTDGTTTVMSEKTAVIQEPKRAASPPWHAASSAGSTMSYPLSEPSKQWPDHR